MGLRDRLRERQLPTITVRVRVDFSDDADAAETALARAQQELRLSEIRGDADSADAQSTVDEAQALVDAGYEPLRVRALPPGDFEALLAAHPPTEEQRKRGDGVNEQTLRAPLLAACIEGEETEADWADFLTKGNVTSGEARSLYFAAMNINDRSADLRVGKD